MNLVIVESPAKCGKIQGYLGIGYKVIATMGHIRALEESLDAIGLSRDFEARYEFLSTKAKALKQLKDSAKEATKIYLASDDDREGEAISYSVCEYLKLNPTTTPRIVFHEITKKAIVSAIESPRLIDINRVNAQQARAILDMMVGFTMSPLLWKHVAPGLSAGRCQTPALRLVVEREDIIQGFQCVSSWKIRGQWNMNSGKVQTFMASLDDDLEDEESALNFLESLQSPLTATVQSIDIKPWYASPPQPLITSTLQQQSSALYSIPPKQTMMCAQKLYEGGYITYMRTDKAVLSEDAVQEIRRYISTNYGGEYLCSEKALSETGEEGKKRKNGAKKGNGGKDKKDDTSTAQEAHEAIRPTHIGVGTLPEDHWTAYERKIYDLIWKRAIQSQMASARGETFTLHFTADAQEEFPWTYSQKRTVFYGWQQLGKVADIDDENEEEVKGGILWDTLMSICVGEKMQWKELYAEPHDTRPPVRFTEATLVRELEKHGIGRPSTFATLISSIQDKNYVEIKNLKGKQISVKSYTMIPGQFPPKEAEVKKAVGAEKQKLVPTDLGRSSLAFMLKHFNDLFDYKFTKNFEERLDRVANGEESYKQILRDMWNSYKERYESLKSTSDGSVKKISSERIREFGDGLKAVISKKGPLLLQEISGKETVFFGWPESVAFQDITEDQVRSFVKQMHGNDLGEWRGQPIIPKSGKFGKYVKIGEISVSITDEDTYETICQKLDAKAEGGDTHMPMKVFKEYEIHNGKFGPYIIKPKLKQRKFVSVPKGITIDTLTEKEVDALYKAGLEAKSRTMKFSKQKAKDDK